MLKLVLNNIIIYTLKWFKGLIVRLIVFLLINFFVKTCISMVNQLLFHGIQHERIKVSAKWINVNENEIIAFITCTEKFRNIGLNYGAPLCSSKHHDEKETSRLISVNVCKCVRAPFLYLPGALTSPNLPQATATFCRLAGVNKRFSVCYVQFFDKRLCCKVRRSGGRRQKLKHFKTT